MCWDVWVISHYSCPQSEACWTYSNISQDTRQRIIAQEKAVFDRELEMKLLMYYNIYKYVYITQKAYNSVPSAKL